jgi:hypothetical protein
MRVVRPARRGDLAQLAAFYNRYVEGTPHGYRLPFCRTGLLACPGSGQQRTTTMPPTLSVTAGGGG